MSSTIFETFPVLWDAFELLLKKEFLAWLRENVKTGTKEYTPKLCGIYRDIGWQFWRFGGKGTDWMRQFEEVFFDSKYYSVTNLLYGYGNLDALVIQSLTEIAEKDPQALYRMAIKPHLDARRQEVWQKLLVLEQELHLPMTYILCVDKQKLHLEFKTRYKRENRYRGMEGYRYSFNKRSYCDVESLSKEPSEEITQNVHIVTDTYGEKVLKCYTQIPTFDSGDREWDSKKVEFLLFDGKNIHLVIMRGGYRIAGLIFYETLISANAGMKPIFEKLGWPTSGIHWT